MCFMWCCAVSAGFIRAQIISRVSLLLGLAVTVPSNNKQIHRHQSQARRVPRQPGAHHNIARCHGDHNDPENHCSTPPIQGEKIPPPSSRTLDGAARAGILTRLGNVEMSEWLMTFQCGARACLSSWSEGKGKRQIHKSTHKSHISGDIKRHSLSTGAGESISLPPPPPLDSFLPSKNNRATSASYQACV